MTSGVSLARELRIMWVDMVREGDLNPEIAYRAEKLSLRMAPLLDKTFLKTIKAGNMLSECREKTTRLQRYLKDGNAKTYHVLTDLERTFEELAKRTYEFRIKAG